MCGELIVTVTKTAGGDRDQRKYKIRCHAQSHIKNNFQCASFLDRKGKACKFTAKTKFNLNRHILLQHKLTQAECLDTGNVCCIQLIEDKEMEKIIDKMIEKCVPTL